jgi:THO complex subunit 1
MPASKGKALPLLRTINAFLRFLSRTPEDLVFRGRVHQFASSVISIADKSAINMRGDYGELKTTWDEDRDAEGDGDVDMGDTNPKAESEDGEGESDKRRQLTW